jgi:hypothetical protein
MAGTLSIPAISREVEFLARHSDEADEIWDDNIEADAVVRELLDDINERAKRSVLQLLNCVQSAVDIALHDLLRSNWGRISPEDWALRGVVYMSARGPKKTIGSAGFYIECRDVPKLIGWVYTRGGLDGRRRRRREADPKESKAVLQSCQANPQRTRWLKCTSLEYYEMRPPRALHSQKLCSDRSKSMAIAKCRSVGGLFLAHKAK